MYWNLTDKERLVTAFTLAAGSETGDNKELMEKFLEDIFTENELKELESRLQIMCLLHDHAPYRSILSMHKVSTKTLTRLAKKVFEWEGGFREVIEKFEKLGKASSD